MTRIRRCVIREVRNGIVSDALYIDARDVTREIEALHTAADEKQKPTDHVIGYQQALQDMLSLLNNS